MRDHPISRIVHQSFSDLMADRDGRLTECDLQPLGHLGCGSGVPPEKRFPSCGTLARYVRPDVGSSLLHVIARSNRELVLRPRSILLVCSTQRVPVLRGAVQDSEDHQNFREASDHRVRHAPLPRTAARASRGRLTTEERWTEGPRSVKFLTWLFLSISSPKSSATEPVLSCSITRSLLEMASILMTRSSIVRKAVYRRHVALPQIRDSLFQSSDSSASRAWSGKTSCQS
jgi:hypothetical protein